MNIGRLFVNDLHQSIDILSMSHSVVSSILHQSAIHLDVNNLMPIMTEYQLLIYDNL